MTGCAENGLKEDSCFVLFNTIAMIGVSYTFLVLVHLLGIWAARGRFTNPKSMEILMENSAAQICLTEIKIKGDYSPETHAQQQQTSTTK